MSDDEKAFLAKIIAEPRNDLVRLVYADWLEADANPPRPAQAHFIRDQIAGEAVAVPEALVRAVVPPRPRSTYEVVQIAGGGECSVQVEQLAVDDAGGKLLHQWVLTYRQGFLTAVEGSWEGLLSTASGASYNGHRIDFGVLPALVAAHPIERVALFGLSPSCWSAGGVGQVWERADRREGVRERSTADRREWVWERSMADPDSFEHLGTGPYSLTQLPEASILPADLFDEMTGGTYFATGMFGHRRYATKSAALADASDAMLARARRAAGGT